ncbi:MAG: hypothetical protein IKS03_10125 [Ruminococcus sp.]|nr:hypothetical protein [Ruminococcus sp.]
MPNLKPIEEQLRTGAEFTLTEEQYLNQTGSTMPKSNSYIKNRSAVAKLAKRYNYKIVITEVPKVVEYEKLMSFERKGE